MGTTSKTKNELVTELAEAMLAASTMQEHDDDKYYTPAVRRGAEVIIELRRQFLNKNGLPDLRGDTFAYRSAVRDALTEANIPMEDRGNLMSALRYHVGQTIREGLTDDEIQEAGFKVSSPKERQKVDRLSKAKVVRAIHKGEEITDPDDVMRALRSCANQLENMRFTGWNKTDLGLAAAFLDALQAQVTEVGSQIR